MKTLSLLLSLIILSSCGSAFPPKEIKKVKVAQEAKPYVASFESKRGQKIDNLEVAFTDSIEGRVLAYCARGEKTVLKAPRNDHYDIRQVVISRAVWDSLGEADREVLVFHELGHCVMDRPHTDARLNSGRPASVMNTYHIGGSTYTSTYGYYLSELFSKPTLSAATFNISEYRVASTFEDEQEAVIHEAVGELHDGCVHDVGHIIEDQTTTTEDTSTED